MSDFNVIFGHQERVHLILEALTDLSGLRNLVGHRA